MINQKEIEEKIRSIAREVLDSTGFADVIGETSEYRVSGSPEREMTIDFTFQVKAGRNKKYLLAFEVKSLGQPRYVRMAANQLQSIIGENKNVYGVFGAPYISEESRRICREEGIGFIDLAGNCLFQFDDVYINVEGKPNPFPARRPLKSIFSRKSTRMLRALLEDPSREWFVKELAEESNISIGMASNLKERLLDYEFIEEVGEGKRKKFRLADPQKLLESWADQYNYRMNSLKSYYVLDEAGDIERRLAEVCDRKGIPYAFTLTSGAGRVAPYLRYSRVFAYLRGSFEEVEEALNLKEVPSGANVVLIIPYDEGVFYGVQEIQGVGVVSDVQLYLDLRSYQERGEEAARFLLENRLRKKW